MLIIEEDKEWIILPFCVAPDINNMDPTGSRSITMVSRYNVRYHRIQKLKYLNQQYFISKEHVNDEFMCDLFGESVAHDDHVRHVGRDTQHNAQH